MMHIQTQSEWEEEMCTKIWNYVQRELYLELRYMKIPLTELVPKKVLGLTTVATDGVSLMYAPERTMELFQKNAGYLNRQYLHTVLHCMFKHPWNRGQREEFRYQVACDIVVEYVIDHMKCQSTRRILSFIRKEIYQEIDHTKKGMSAAVIYRMLSDKTEEEIQQLYREFFTDDHRFFRKGEECSSEELQIQKRWDKISKQTALEQRRQGDTENEGERLLQQQISAAKSRRSYQDFLKKFSVCREQMHLDLDEFDLNYYSYGLRVYGNLPLIEPLETKEIYRIREFVIVIDTSESTSGELIQAFLEETFHILSLKNQYFAQFEIRILQCDNQVRCDQVIKHEKDIQKLIQDFTLQGKGTTDFRPAFEYVEALRSRGELKHLGGLLYFTDGKGIYPTKKPSYPTAFLFLDEYEEEKVPVWAMRLELLEEEFYEYQTGKTGN